jgi:hypothetical protein
VWDNRKGDMEGEGAGDNEEDKVDVGRGEDILKMARIL